MERKIRVLDPNTANKIAAGEVVERPASVVKELVENALDAGATSIEVQIEGGGIEYIRVTDNGVGMSEEDAKLAILRHATSKIRTEEDLLFVDTLGFRGEALPSIASVSRFTLLTRLHDQELAVQVKITGGENLEVSQAGGQTGTSIIVEELFLNVPARRKFLRTANTEGRYISDALTKIAISRPDVKFSLLNGGRQVMKTPGNDQLVDTIAGIYGAKTKEELLAVALEKDGVSVSGYVGKPSFLKSSRGWQTIIVNGRTITSRFISRALDQAYQSQLPRGGYPFAVVNINVDTTQIDVNVHPQKSEIRFSDEQGMFKVVYRAIADALQKPLANVEQKPCMEEEKKLPVAERISLPFEPIQKPVSSMKYKPQIFNSQPGRVSETVFFEKEKQQVEKVDFATAQSIIADDSIITTKEEHDAENENPIMPIGQIDRMYIVAQTDTELFLIDQHAAHERIIFDRLCAKQKDIPVQELLLPLYIELNSDDVDLALEHNDVFSSLCFELEAAGPDVIMLNTVPADLSMQELNGFFKEALLFIRQMKHPDPAELRKELVAMASCKAAIKGGQNLNIRQMKELIAELMKTEHPFTCPHGRPVIIRYSSGDLARLFKRT